MRISIDVKFISIVHLYREVQEIKGCSGLQNIPQIAGVVRRVVFLFFLLCF